MEKLEFVSQVVSLVVEAEVDILSFENFYATLAYHFPVLNEDITYSYLQILYHHIKELME